MDSVTLQEITICPLLFGKTVIFYLLNPKTHMVHFVTTRHEYFTKNQDNLISTFCNDEKWPLNRDKTEMCIIRSTYNDTMLFPEQYVPF